METIKLTAPIKIDGKEVTELTCDMDAIGVEDFMAADALSTAKRTQTGGLNPMIAAFDKGLHLYLGFAGILAANPGYDMTDLERIKGMDIMKVINVGRDFTTGSLDATAASESGN